MRDERVTAVMERVLIQHGESDDPGHTTPDGRRCCFACDSVWPCDASVLAAEVRRLYRHLERFADAANDGFVGRERDDVWGYGCDAYAWARNYAAAIRHPDSPLGKVLADDLARTQAGDSGA